MSDSLQPHGLYSPCPWNSPGQNTGVYSRSLLQEIFLTQGSSPGLLHCRQILYHLSHSLGSMRNVNWAQGKDVWGALGLLIPCSAGRAGLAQPAALWSSCFPASLFGLWEGNLNLVSLIHLLWTHQVGVWQEFLDVSERAFSLASFIIFGSQITTDVDCSHEIKRCLLLERKAMRD